MKIGLDAGHGGNDPGAIDPMGRLEKDFTLTICLCAASYAAAAGHSFYLSRIDDTRVPLRRRAQSMNEQGVDCVVCVHWNASASSEPNGTQVYYHTNSDHARRLAKIMLERVGGLDNDRSERWERVIAVPNPNYRGGWVHPVIALTQAPAVLLEVEFATNPIEAVRLADPQFQVAVAREIVGSVEDWQL